MVCGRMPFDQEDTKRVIKLQLDRRKNKIPSKILERLDPHVCDLIYLMLEPDVTKRPNIEKVLRQPWLTSS